MYDFVIVGAGIVGLSTAWQLKQALPEASILLVDKEERPAMHQTGHNSGVVHAGVYYQPGSAKARFCKEGAEAVDWFCRREKLPFDRCGKLLVATNAEEDRRIEALVERCAANGIEYRLIGHGELAELEPNIRSTRAILVPATAITDYPAICRRLLELFLEDGGEVRFSLEAESLSEEAGNAVLRYRGGRIAARSAIACAGLQADRLARSGGRRPGFAIVPFRGEYYRLPPAKNDIVRHLIYPIPDPSLPFLGVHLTRMIDGSVTVGPNAVLGLAREGYAKAAVSPADIAEMVASPGFWKMALGNWRAGASELYNSLNRRGYLELCRKYCPSLQLSDLRPYPAGIRAQAVSPAGELHHDFLIEETPRTLHVCNAPSPAATSSMPIGRHIVELVMKKAAGLGIAGAAERQLAPPPWKA
ncbi:L-2-hydroxyglutarate oxidase [Afifella sp. IM 167]|uniref:L-2-hydroxyglutarate oxidase n=1 Tax=Afifella sp. IM 167 TaxID=2033586 RepID=UPI001CCEAF9E